LNTMEDEQLKRIFQVIKNDKSQENHFFEVLAGSSNPLPWLKPLIERGYFDPNNNPPPEEVPNQKGFFTIPRWNVLGYLENAAQQNTKNPTDEITSLLASVVDSIIKYKNKAGERIDNHITDCAVVKIAFALPVANITEEHIEFIRTALRSRWSTASLIASVIDTSALRQLIHYNTKELLLKLLDVVLDYQKKDERSLEKYVSVIDEYWLNDMLEKHKIGIAKLCAVEAAGVALSKMRRILSEDASQFHAGWVTTIEDHPQMHFPNHYQCRLVRFVRDMYESAEPQQLREIIVTLTQEKDSIFKRIAIHTINKQYKALKDLFWKWQGNPLEEKWLKHELYELLKARSPLFTTEQLMTVLNWIETKNYYVPDDMKEESERDKLLAYRKKEWLSAIISTKAPSVISVYQKYEAVEPEQPDHPGFDFWTETRWGGNASLIDKNELLKKSNTELAKYMRDFKGTGRWREPDQEDLSEAFRDCVSNYPERYSTDLVPFLDINRVYQHALIWGLYNAWHAEKSFPWDDVLKFISDLIASDEFWSETAGTQKYSYRDQLIGQIATLIQEGTKDDRHAFDQKLLPQAEKILLTLAEKTDSHIKKDKDFINLALNSPKGQILSSMVNYSLRHSRVSGKDAERWVKPIKQYFNHLLNDPAEPTIEFFVTLGLYLPNLFYLDKEWVVSNVNQIFSITNDEAWQAVFTGYVYSTNAVYRDLYMLLRQNGHYLKGLKTDFTDSHCVQRIVGHICVGYLEEWEKLDDKKSLMSELVGSGHVDRLSDIIDFFWGLRDDATERIREKIKPLWRSLVEVLSKKEQDPEYQKAISTLSRWLSLVDSIDEQILEWLKFSAKYIETNFNSSFLIEYLLPHTAKTPDKVGKVFLAVLHSDVYPQYKRENIENIVRQLYAYRQGEIADTICNLYMTKGVDFLKPIYEENLKAKNKANEQA
jgi:hypothetical protein